MRHFGGEITYFDNYYLALCFFVCFSSMCLYCRCGSCLQYNQIAANWASSMLLKLLAGGSDTLWKSGVCKIARASHEGGVLEKVIGSSRGSDRWLTRDLHPRNPGSSPPSPHPLNVCSVHQSHSSSQFQGCRLERAIWCWDHLLNI